MTGAYHLTIVDITVSQVTTQVGFELYFISDDDQVTVKILGTFPSGGRWQFADTC